MYISREVFMNAIIICCYVIVICFFNSFDIPTIEEACNGNKLCEYEYLMIPYGM